MVRQRPHRRTVSVVGVDLGGTKILAAHVDDAHGVAAKQKVKTPVDGSASVVAAIAAAVEELGGKPDVVGVGAPRPVADGVVMTAPNLVGWTRPVPLREELSAALGVPVVVDNDATVGAVGECVADAGHGSRFMLGVWLGTGVGGGLVLEGQPFRGALGAAGEFGHMVIRRHLRRPRPRACDVAGNRSTSGCRSRHTELVVVGHLQRPNSSSPSS